MSRVRVGAALLIVVLFGSACAPDDPLAAERSVECTPQTGSHSVARMWNEANLDAIRRDFPAPTVHARNLFHTSVAMWDTWAAFESGATAHLVDRTTTLPRHELDDAVSAAAHRVLSERYRNSVGGAESLDQFDATLRALCGDPDRLWSPGAELGDEIARQVLARSRTDGSNENNGYSGAYEAVNPGLQVALAYTSMADPNRWQPLDLERRITQNGQDESETLQTFIGPHWGSVTPFALDADAAPVPGDPGPPPLLTLPVGTDPIADQIFVGAAVEVIAFGALLDPTSEAVLDISPGGWGNSSLGTNDGSGRAVNPATGDPYEPNRVGHSDFGRVLAEFWADGPSSETPPGHWNTLANTVSDELEESGELRIGGNGPAIDRLQWDLSLYIALNGATHDAAIAAWGTKAAYDYSRPISMIRYLAGLGQSTDSGLDPFHPSGLPLVDGLIRVDNGEVMIRGWEGTGGDWAWIRAGEWVPYQLSTFVTPAFAAYVSGHSTFSRAAAEVLAGLTGSDFFPGGLGEWTIPAGWLEFDPGPSEDIVLQWATYYDAADQAGLSRLYGGIHVWADDLRGREMGAEIGQLAWAKAQELYP